MQQVFDRVKTHDGIGDNLRQDLLLGIEELKKKVPSTAYTRRRKKKAGPTPASTP